MKIKAFQCIIATAILLTSATAQAWPKENNFSGQAFVVKANVAGLINTTFIDTGLLPSQGGSLKESLKELDLPGLISAQLLEAETWGGGDVAGAEARVADVSVAIGGIGVIASLVESTTKAECVYGQPKASGNAQIDSLSVAGIPIKITDEPNAVTTIKLPIVGKLPLLGDTLPLVGTVKVVLEETKKSYANPWSAAITVNAVHIIVKNLLGLITSDVIISSAHSDISCAG